MTIDQTEDIDIRLARARLRGHQMRRAATASAREATDDIRERRQADETIAYLDRQIDRLTRWLAARGATE